MKTEDPEDKAIAAYLELLDREVSRDQVAKDKKEFIARNFRPRPVWMPALPVLVPAMAAAIALLVFNFVPQMKPQKAAAPVTAPANAPVAKTSLVAPAVPAAEKPVKLEIPDAMKKKKFFRIPRIWVKKVTSDIGQPMIYQRKANNVPVTVIWVFTPQQPVNNKPVQPGITT
jgi:hypothetical protein